jgi:hypothetical protein
MNELLNACLPFARRMIEQHGEFHPFGASLATDGTVQFDGVDSDAAFPPGREVVELLRTALRAKAELEEINAAAICANVDMRAPGDQTQDAIQVAIEHRDAEPILVFMPYRKTRLRGYEFDDLSAVEGVRTVFAA